MAVRIGLQLYSVRNALAESSAATFKGIADLGYRYLEAANHAAGTDDGIGFGLPAGELRSTLSDFGLQVVGCHINPLKLERLPEVLDYQAEIGNTQIGCDIEFYPPGDRDYVLRRADFFNEVGRLCADREMRFYYHNHYQEFQYLGAERCTRRCWTTPTPNWSSWRWTPTGCTGAGRTRWNGCAATPTGSCCCTRRTSRPKRRSRCRCTTEPSTSTPRSWTVLHGGRES